MEHPYPADGAERFVAKAMAADSAVRLRLAVALREGGQLIGVIGTWLRDGEAVIGYWIDPGQWRKGYGWEALGALLDHLANERGIRVFKAGTKPDNAASIGLLRKAGFLHVGEREDVFPARGTDPVRTLLWRLDIGSEGLPPR
ncbi:MAG: GNAT family N-acetyltransferase [Bauldia sp.]